jgi:MFS family permease
VLTISWSVRFILFMLATDGGAWWAIVGIALHGVCNDFFLIIGYMYVDRIAPSGIRAQAQALFSVLTTGVGVAIGSAAGGVIFNLTIGSQSLSAASSGWSGLFLVPTIVALLATLVFALYFKRQDQTFRQPPAGLSN